MFTPKIKKRNTSRPRQNLAMSLDLNLRAISESVDQIEEELDILDPTHPLESTIIEKRIALLQFYVEQLESTADSSHLSIVP